MVIKARGEVTVFDQTDADALVTWYQLTSSATKPSKPATTIATDTPSGWTKAEPAFTEGGTKYLYTCLQTVWKNGKCDWGDVQLDSGYEAAKVAYNQAVAAGNKVDGLEIGGRNLLTDTSDEWHEISLSATQWYYEAHTGYELEIGETYTFSIIVEKVSADSVPIQLHLGNGINGQYTHDIIGWRQGALPFGERVSLTYTITEADLARTSSDTTVAPFLSWRLRNDQHATTIRYRCVKLERGNKPTDWTPAPEDVDDGIEDAKTTATRYITDITDGIFVAPDGQGPSDTSTPTGWRIKDALELIKSGISAFRVWLEDGMAKVRIGESDNSHMELDYHSMRMVDREGDTYFHVSDLRDANGVTEAVDAFTADGLTRIFDLSFVSQSTDYVVTVDGVVQSSSQVSKSSSSITFSSAPSSGKEIVVTYYSASQELKGFTFGNRAEGVIGAYSVAEGKEILASGKYSHAEGQSTIASGKTSHAEGYKSEASVAGAHAEGQSTIASGSNAHAEGWFSNAIGHTSHAEGRSTARGSYSHAEGESYALGFYSHTQNQGTLATGVAQTAIGKYNLSPSNYAFIIGNGTDANDRSNAFAVDWDGNVPIAGDVQDMSGALRYAPIAYGSLTGMASTLTLSTTAQQLPLGGTFVGNGCSASSNGVMVEEAGTYMITGSAYLFGGYTANDIVHLTINAGSTEVADCVFRAPTANPYQTISTAPVVVQLAANTVVTLWAYNQVAARGTINSRAGHGLTVLRIA